jgi:hypothetical protein
MMFGGATLWLKSAAMMCAGVPAPPVPYETLPGLAFT